MKGNDKQKTAWIEGLAALAVLSMSFTIIIPSANEVLGGAQEKTVQVKEENIY